MRRLCCLILLLCVLVGTINFVQAKTGSFIIDAGKDYYYKIDLASTDKLHLTFVTTGDSSSEFRFSITFPNSTYLDLGEVDKYSTSFTSDTTGTCELYFDNTNSMRPTLVALNYEVDHYILGIPQMIFALIVIFVLVMVIVIGYVVMGKYS
jgi:hypothetical protein